MDASAATIEKDHAASSVSALAVGDDVLVQGTVNGTSITATSVIDSGTQTETNQNNAQMNQKGTGHPEGFGGMGMFGGFFGGVGGFLHNLFGFF